MRPPEKKVGIFLKVSEISKLQKSGDLMVRVQEGMDCTFPYFFPKTYFCKGAKRDLFKDLNTY